MALEATVRTRRVLVRLRRPCLPHFGQGAFLGAHRTGITIGVGASVPMACISGVEDVKYPHSAPSHATSFCADSLSRNCSGVSLRNSQKLNSGSLKPSRP